MCVGGGGGSITSCIPKKPCHQDTVGRAFVVPRGRGLSSFHLERRAHVLTPFTYDCLCEPCGAGLDYCTHRTSTPRGCFVATPPDTRSSPLSTSQAALGSLWPPPPAILDSIFRHVKQSRSRPLRWCWNTTGTVKDTPYTTQIRRTITGPFSVHRRSYILSLSFACAQSPAG